MKRIKEGYFFYLTTATVHLNYKMKMACVLFIPLVYDHVYTAIQLMV